MALPTLDIIKSVLPLITAAVDTIQQFTGDDPKVDSTVQNAVEILGAAFPLIQTWSDGDEVTLEDAEEAFAGYDQAMADLQAEIARQGG